MWRSDINTRHNNHISSPLNEPMVQTDTEANAHEIENEASNNQIADKRRARIINSANNGNISHIHHISICQLLLLI